MQSAGRFILHLVWWWDVCLTDVSVTVTWLSVICTQLKTRNIIDILTRNIVYSGQGMKFMFCVLYIYKHTEHKFHTLSIVDYVRSQNTHTHTHIHTYTHQEIN